MATKIDVTVLEGTVDDGKQTYTRGKHLKMDADEAEGLINTGVVAKGKIDVGAITKASSAAEPLPMSATRFMEIVKTVGTKLDRNNEKHFTQDGKPEVNALKEAGLTINAEERDEFWSLYNTGSE